MRLYYSPAACSLAPHIVAREAGVEIDLVKVNLATKLTESGDDFLKLNAKGTVPALVLDEGTVLTEGAVVSQFLADLRPDTGLLPSFGTIDRYRALEWLNFVATELHKGFGPLWRKETPSEMRVTVTNALAGKFSYLDRHLKGRDYLLGNNFGVADAYAFTVLSWAPHLDIELGRWPNIVNYVERISSRPNVRIALSVEGLPTPANVEA